jgi:hypothetical protein
MTFHVRLISLPDRTNDLDEALALDVGRWRRSHDVIGRMRSILDAGVAMLPVPAGLPGVEWCVSGCCCPTGLGCSSVHDCCSAVGHGSSRVRIIEVAGDQAYWMLWCTRLGSFATMSWRKGRSMELARLWLGLTVALTLPLDLRVLRRNYVISVVFTLIYSAYITFPVLNSWQSTLICLATVLLGTAAVLMLRRRPAVVHEESKSAQDPSLVQYPEKPYDWRQTAASVRSAASSGSVALIATVGLAFVLALATGSLYGAGVIHHLHHVWFNDSVAVVVSGLLVAMFAVNHLVYLTVRPLIRKLGSQGENLIKLLPNSESIGWIERALVFTFIAGGQADAAALAIAVKSLARLPNVGDHAKGFTEYFLVGTLASLLAAVAVAVLVRVALGQAPL